MLCPNCGRDHGRSLLGLAWCPGDRAYFCVACTKERTGCPACGSRPSGFTLGLAGLIVFFLLVSSSAMVLPQHWSRALDMQMPNTYVANASTGQEVKMLVKIDSPDRSAFTILFRDGRWQLQQRTSFTLVDSRGGRIVPDLAKCRDFYPASHNLSVPDRREFWDGDQVTVFGRVGLDDGGNTTLEVRRLYPGATDPYEQMPEWYQTLWLVPTISLFLLLQVLVMYAHRRWQHAGYLRKHPAPGPESASQAQDEKDVKWHESHLPAQLLKRSKTLAAASLLLFLAVLVPSALAPWLWDEQALWLGTGIVLMGFAAAGAFMDWENTHLAPVSLGISKKALHFRYLSKTGPPANMTVLRWPELSRYSSNVERGTVRMKFFTDERTESVLLPREFQKLIDEEHARPRGKN